MFFKEVAKTRLSRTLLEIGQDLLDAIFAHDDFEWSNVKNGVRMQKLWLNEVTN
jgi:hypothetical protein